MEFIIFIGLVVVGLVIFYHWNKKDVPADVVKTEQAEAPKAEEVPYKVEAPVPPEVATLLNQVAAAPAVVAEPVKAEPAKAKPARKTAAKKTAAKKTAGAKKPVAKKKSA